MNIKHGRKPIVPVVVFQTIFILPIIFGIMVVLCVLLTKPPNVQKPKIVKVCYICPNLSCGSTLLLLSECNYINVLPIEDDTYTLIKPNGNVFVIPDGSKGMGTYDYKLTESEHQTLYKMISTLK